MSSYSRPQVPEIRIDGDDSFDTNKMLLGLATQIATKVISDSFYQQRKDKVTDDSRRMLNVVDYAQESLKLADPIQIENEINNLNTILEKNQYVDGSPLSRDERNRYLQSVQMLENRKDLLTNQRSRDVAELAGDVNYWEKTLSNIGTQNDAGYYDADLLEKSLGEINDLIIRTESSEGYTAGASSDILAHKRLKQIESTLSTQYNMAKAVDTLNEKIATYGQNLDLYKGDDKKYAEKGAEYLKDLSDYVSQHSQYQKHLSIDELNDLRDDILVTTQGHHFDNFIDKLRADETFTHPESTQLLELADEMIAVGMANNDKGTIGKGINTVKTAITKEAIADKTAQIAEQKVQKAFADETLSGLSQAAEDISRTVFGKGTATAMEQKALLHEDYKTGPLRIMQNPESQLTKYTGTEQHMVQLKVKFGQQVSKLVKSSDLYDDDESIKKLVDDTLTGNGDFVKQDELYDALISKWENEAEEDKPDEGLELNFTGTGKADDAARELYKKYLLLYGVLRGRHQSAIESFGSEYGYGKVKTKSSPGDPLKEQNKALEEAIQKLLQP